MRRALLLTGLCLVLAGCSISKAEESAPVKPLKRLVAQAVSSSSKTTKLQPIGQTSSQGSSKASVAVVTTTQTELPPAVQLDVPFTSQAPHKNWAEPYQNACEEAALLMVMHYLEDRPFTPELADEEIVDLTKRTSGMGYKLSITMDELADITRTLYPQYQPVLSTDVTVESVKKMLADGKPVIIPAAGRALKNPYYSGEGPWYHMLVVTGYDAQFFYTNDPGTGVGYRYPYPHDLLIDAVHDWTGQDEMIGQGRKVMMTLKKS